MDAVELSGHMAAIQGPDADSGASGHRVLGYSESPMALFMGGSLFKPHGRLKLTLLAICIDIANL